MAPATKVHQQLSIESMSQHKAGAAGHLARYLACHGLVIVALSAGGCKLISEPERDSLDVPLSEIIDLTRRGGSLPVLADGTTEDTLVATIPEQSTSRLVTFNTTGGRFVLAGPGKQLKVTAVRDSSRTDDRLVAKAVIRSDSAIIAITSASVLDFTAYLPVTFVKP
ncbi:MAG TPA: hypothetical protein VFJ82_21560 [Longimicrobium sp.]|nr:hypothetical protein [Longimicrobium sp.]